MSENFYDAEKTKDTWLQTYTVSNEQEKMNQRSETTA
jgi:hypothetical protein